VEAALRKDITRARDEIEAKQDQEVRHFAETAAAIRQKVHEVELWTANTFLRRDSFYKAQEDLKAEMKALGDKIDARLERRRRRSTGRGEIRNARARSHRPSFRACTSWSEPSNAPISSQQVTFLDGSLIASCAV
jgi:hypothetical protein